MTDSPVAVAILLLTIATSLYTLFVDPNLLRRFLLHPWSLIRHGRYYTVITSGLIHADPGHLLFNMFTFYFFAFPLERFLGHWQFLVLYVVSMVASDVTTIIKHRDDRDYCCLGASGAVTAVLFSFIIYEPLARIYIMFIPIGIPAPIFGVLYIAFSYYAGKKHHGRINHEAHLWGAVSGLLLTLILDPQAYLGFLETLKSGG